MQQQAYTGVDNLEVMQEAVNYNRYLLDTVRKHAPARGKVLDFGAGSGQFAAPLSQHGMDITALEPDQLLQQRLRAQGLRVVSSTQEIPDASLDYIYTLNVLEHIDDDAGALRILHAKLTAKGKLLIYVPAFQLLYTSMDAKVGHVRRYTRGMLMTRVRDAGFKIEHVAYADSIGFFATLAFKAIGNKDGNVSLGALKLYDRAVFPLSRGLDSVAKRWFGKNLLLVASKP
ncbi:class I SAM-dependent methyltransferase [Steroidobacter sp. S1-65]|uniref:Class I SAM-dependent methyltransferase n=1 Tax=Steroidobacter gossypii TaxID=2805490 RepID=A0ABS1WR55_9GAMM|nr:class I SAM-dependent methyltransferase [Steroidobacter gossypii]MBM0103447.1 class I SAM-dependent methyltransferase [Steroidobacter gossypii]